MLRAPPPWLPHESSHGRATARRQATGAAFRLSACTRSSRSVEQGTQAMHILMPLPTTPRMVVWKRTGLTTGS